MYKVEESQPPVSVTQCYNCQSFGHSAENCRSKQKCLICGESHSLKGCRNKEARKPKCANYKGPHVASHKGCPEYKQQAFRQHVVNNQKSYAAAVSQNILTQPKTNQTFSFTTEQLTKFLANVVIQIAQPQVYYPSPKQNMPDLKSSMCRKISNAAKTILSVDVSGKDCLNPPVLSTGNTDLLDMAFIFPNLAKHDIQFQIGDDLGSNHLSIEISVDAPPHRNSSVNHTKNKLDQTDREVFDSALEAALGSEDFSGLTSTSDLDKYVDFIVSAISTAVDRAIPKSKSV